MDLGTCLIENNGESMVLGIFDAHLQFVLVDLIVAQDDMSFCCDELSNQAQPFAEENFTWTFPSQYLAWTVI